MNKSTPPLIGTVFASESFLQKADAHSDKMFRNALENARKELKGLEEKIVGGEIRFYKDVNTFTVVSINGNQRNWFEIRKNGHTYRIK